MSAIQPLRRIGGTALADLLGRDASAADVSYMTRIDAALDWLCRAQDNGNDRGFSYGYTIKGGWQSSYIETTGYIICTFLNAAEVLGRPDLEERAVEAGRWLTSVQLEDGSFANPELGADRGVVFDTGQDLFGLLALARGGHGPMFDDAARRATEWLTKVTNDEGRWTRNTFNGIPHVYNSRVAWALAKAAVRFDNDAARAVAVANLDWACDQQLANGWFEHCAFTPDAAPFTHTTAYAGRGLLESSVVLDEKRYLSTARGVAEAAGRHLDRSGRLPGQVSTDDESVSRSSCLTGSAQFAIIWLRLAEIEGDDRYRAWGLAAVEAVGRHQNLDGRAETRGATKGSDPIWGRYAPLGYPNWATKFFIDALLLAKGAKS